MLETRQWNQPQYLLSSFENNKEHVVGEVEFLSRLFDVLFPICRSITGPGIRNSLEILADHIPIQIHGVPTGTKVFDWTIPDEWHIRGARLTGSDGKVYADFSETNLSVVNFSEPVDQELSLDELQPHLHSIPTLPDAIPYVTSYYARNWGFCIPHQVLSNLPEGRYHAWIDSEFKSGVLNYGELVLPGETSREFLLTSYLCHPSLANNELSGPLVMLALYNRILQWPRRRLTYRFVIAPETIGSLTYLSLMGDHLKENLVGGLILTCLGGPNKSLSYKTSRREDALIDQTVRYMKETGDLDVDIRPFTPVGGSDGRQYCSPGFNLPVGQIARTVYGAYKGYHNSLDTKDFLRIDSLVASAEAISRLLRSFEYTGCFQNLQPYGEPQLGRRNLYPNVNSPDTWNRSTDTFIDERELLNRILMILSYSDGQHSMISIARRCNTSVSDLIPIVQKLEDEELLAESVEGWK